MSDLAARELATRSLAGAPPPPNTRRRSRGEEERRSLVRLRNQGAQEYEAEMDPEYPPVPPSGRKLTDPGFLCIFILYWVGMFIIGGVAVPNGNPLRMIYGTDYQGNICGDAAGSQAGKPYLVYPRSEQDIDQVALYNTLGFEVNIFDVDFFTVCRESCPNEGDYVCTYEAEEAVDAAITATGFTRDVVISGCILDPFQSTFPNPNCQAEIIQKQCWETFFDNEEILFRCFPEYTYDVELLGDESECLVYRNYTVGVFVKEVCVKFKEVSKVTRVEPLETNVVFDLFNTVDRVFEGLYGDMLKASDVILFCGIVVSLFIGLLYVGSLWCCVGIVVWMSVVACVVLMLSFSIYCFIKGGVIEVSAVSSAVDDILSGATSLLNSDSDGVITNGTVSVASGAELPVFIGASIEYEDEFRVAAYILSVLTFILLIIIISLAPRIARAIEIFKEASRAVRKNLALILVPPFGVAVIVAIIIYWLLITAYVTTSGVIIDTQLPDGLEDTLNITELDLNTKAFGPLSYIWLFNIYLLFGALWSLAFTSGVTHMIMSYVVTKWYWSGSPDEYRTAGRRPILNALNVVFFKHLGSIAFGSLLIASIQIVRYIAAFIQHRFNQVETKSRVVRYLFLSLNCCLKCAEMCIKFISKHAYVMTAMYGTPFCTSTKMVFSAISHNLAQVATVTFLGDIILRFGQIVVVLLSGIICWAYLDGNPIYGIGGALHLSSFAFPVFLTMVLAWFISYEILNVYDVAVDTILISYCQDKKLFEMRGSRHIPQYHKNYTDFLNENKPGAPLSAQNSLSVYA